MATPIRTRKISHVLLHVSDIERSVKFYTEILGFKESDRNQPTPSRRHGGLDGAERAEFG
jgi:catechol 2,3-dioxygenase-like lactoylglutathione lyase family enzyme